MHADLDLAFLIGLDDCKKLDAIAEAFRKANVGRGDLLNTLHENLVGAHPETIRERGKDDRLVRGVPAVDVECRVGLRVTAFLRLAQSFLESQSGFRHPGEDVVAGAVDDTVH